ncbi:hypothetical protein ABE522_06125 [Stenotrophomonas pennii]|uniref:hypothetical protein n=1 Tax=Stenotrophomonas lacuserhaii TaxID=2760084 RepID=UPI00320AF3BC
MPHAGGVQSHQTRQLRIVEGDQRSVIQPVDAPPGEPARRRGRGAARFYYLQKLAFGGKVQGQSFGLVASGGPRLNLLRIEEELSAVHIRLASVVIEHLPWQECIRRYDRPGALFYLDPPYWQTGGYGVPFGMEQYEEMAALMRGMKGRAVLSINDHPDIRHAFEGLALVPLQLEYTMARQSTGKKSGELIIKSWEDDQLPMWG